mgnify:CR=1 FL=1
MEAIRTRYDADRQTSSESAVAEFQILDALAAGRRAVREFERQERVLRFRAGSWLLAVVAEHQKTGAAASRGAACLHRVAAIANHDCRAQMSAENAGKSRSAHASPGRR